MSTHPNCLLLGVLVPDDLPSKTYRAVCADLGLDHEDGPHITIDGQMYHLRLMDGSYDEDMQVAAPEGATVFVGMVTYGYGETRTWEGLVACRNALDEKLSDLAARHHCEVRILVSANYW